MPNNGRENWKQTIFTVLLVTQIRKTLSWILWKHWLSLESSTSVIYSVASAFSESWMGLNLILHVLSRQVQFLVALHRYLSQQQWGAEHNSQLTRQTQAEEGLGKCPCKLVQPNVRFKVFCYQKTILRKLSDDIILQITGHEKCHIMLV